MRQWSHRSVGAGFGSVVVQKIRPIAERFHIVPGADKDLGTLVPTCVSAFNPGAVSDLKARLVVILRIRGNLDGLGTFQLAPRQKCAVDAELLACGNRLAARILDGSAPDAAYLRLSERSAEL